MAMMQVAFNPNGGTGGQSGRLYLNYQVSSPSAPLENVWWSTTSSASGMVSTVDVPTREGYVFDGYWSTNGVCCADRSGFLVLPAYASQLPAETASARWTASAPTFGDVVDWFGLGSASLVPFESDDGRDRPRVVTAHYGRHSADVRTSASQTLADITASESARVEWLNPTVRYMVVADMTLDLQLGKAFAASTGATGYMLTSALVETVVRGFPVVTVSGVANEGADAINRFFVSVHILARARAQNLLGAISGGGELQRLSLLAAADPVVVELDMAPCASDVVNGRLEVQAETLAPMSSNPPAAAGGFAMLRPPASLSATGYCRYTAAARKEIV